MKKVLSIILAIAMIATFIPAVSAAGEEAIEDLKIVYSFESTLYKGNTTKVQDMTYEKTGERWAYAEDTCSYGYDWNSDYTYLYHKTGEYAALKIRVPKAGTYDVKYEYLKKSDAISAIYIGESVDDALASTAICTTVAGSGDGISSATGTFTATEAKEYYLVIKKTGGDWYQRPVGLTLTMVDEGMSAAIIGSLKEELVAGTTATIKGYDSAIAEPTELTGLSYSSSNSAVATVSIDGVIEAKGAGTATITTSKEGYYPLTTTVTVTDPTKPTVMYDIGGYMVENGFNLGVKDTIKLTDITFDSTNGFFAFKGGNVAHDSDNGFYYRGNYFQFLKDQYISFEVEVPKDGKYDFYAYHPIVNNSGGTEVYYTKVEDYSAASFGKLAGKIWSQGDSSSPGLSSNMELHITKFDYSLQLEAGRYVFTFKAVNNYATASSFSLVSGTGNALLGYLKGDTTLGVGETATLSGYLSASGESATVEYSSSSDCVSVDENGTITAVKPGKATVTMTETAGKATAGNTYTVEITVQDLKAAFDAEPVEKNDYVAPTVVGLGFDGEVLKATDNKNGTFTLTAEATNGEGEKFLYWAVGNTDKKRIVSFNNVIDDYVPAEEGRNYLIAVYEGDIASDKNEYYNQNGQLIAKQTEAPELPSMAGYGAAESWEKYGSTNIYVAQYGDAPKLADVTVTVVGGKGTATVPFGGSVTCTATGDNFKCWTKSGINGEEEIVSVDKTYTFKAWEDCTVTATYATHTPLGTAMKIIIDSFTAGNETGVMAEFIGLDNAVEKGIIWKTGTDETKIAMTTTDNQFTVIADKAGEYIGYAILKSGDVYSIITDGLYKK